MADETNIQPGTGEPELSRIPQPGEIIHYQKVQIVDGALMRDALALSISRGDDGGGPKLLLIVDSEIQDVDLFPIRDKIARCLGGKEICPDCKWPVEVSGPVVVYQDGIRDNKTWGCYCTFFKGAGK